MKLTLHVWRQSRAPTQRADGPYPLDGISPDMSFLEMLDVLNERLDQAGARSRSRSTTTAARASAARAR